MVSSTATDSAAKVYTCPTCARQFNKKANLKVHSRKHTGEKPYACSRPGCDRRFMWKSSVSFHEQNCVAGSGVPSGNGRGGGGASSVPKRHKMMMSSTAAMNSMGNMGNMANMNTMNMANMGMQQQHLNNNDATSSLLSIIPNSVQLESSPPRPHVTNVVQMPVDYGMQQQQHHQQHPDFLRAAMQSNPALAQQQQYLFQQQQQQQHHQQQQAMSMSMAAASASRQQQQPNNINTNPFSMLPTTVGSSAFPTASNGLGGLRNPLLDSANLNTNNNMSSTSSASGVPLAGPNNNIPGNLSAGMPGSVSAQPPSAMFSHISHLDSSNNNSTRPLHPVILGSAGSGLPVHTTPTLPPSFPTEANPLPAPSTILESKAPAVPSAARPPLFLGKSNLSNTGTKGMKMPIAMELDESDDDEYTHASANGNSTAGIIGAQETFMRTGNIFTFAPPPRCSPLPASSPIVGHGISAMPLSPLAPFSPLPPDSPAHNAPNPVHPPLNQPPRPANTNF